MKVCSRPGCAGAATRRGWCGMHYQRWRAHGDPDLFIREKYEPDIDRFSRMITKDHAGCWLWSGSLDMGGYGRFAVDDGGKKAHRWIWEYHNGPVPKGLQLDHLCRVRRCANPDHLEPVTPSVNVLRGVRHNAQKTHCKYGHPFDEANTRRSVKGSRVCRACSYRSLRAWREGRASGQ